MFTIGNNKFHRGSDTNRTFYNSLKTNSSLRCSQITIILLPITGMNLLSAIFTNRRFCRLCAVGFVIYVQILLRLWQFCLQTTTLFIFSNSQLFSCHRTLVACLIAVNFSSNVMLEFIILETLYPLLFQKDACLHGSTGFSVHQLVVCTTRPLHLKSSSWCMTFIPSTTGKPYNFCHVLCSSSSLIFPNSCLRLIQGSSGVVQLIRHDCNRI